MIALLLSMHQLIAQTTPSQKMDEFLEKKADAFNTSYENKDVKTYNALLSEYLSIYEKLSEDEKKQNSYILNNIYYTLSCTYSLLNNKPSALTYLKKAIDASKTVVIKTEKMDSSEKYGRILGWVFLDGSEISINQKMINDGYAWGYLGDTKVKDFEALAKARSKSKK